MDLINNHWESFTVVALGLGFLIYSMIKIKNEPDDYKKYSAQIIFGELKLQIPSWWTISHEQEGYLSFYRSDTYYEWQSTFAYLSSLKHFQEDEVNKPNLSHLLEDYLDKRNIDLDPEKSYSHVQAFENQNSIRVEGMGTQNVEKRIYLDLAIIHYQHKIYFLESISSVLNGGIEGPYFDEIINHINLLHTN